MKALPREENKLSTTDILICKRKQTRSFFFCQRDFIQSPPNEKIMKREEKIHNKEAMQVMTKKVNGGDLRSIVKGSHRIQVTV